MSSMSGEVASIIKELVPEERAQQLLEQYNALKEEYKKRKAELAEMEAKLRNWAGILKALGFEIEEVVPTVVSAPTVAERRVRIVQRGLAKEVAEKILAKGSGAQVRPYIEFGAEYSRGTIYQAVTSLLAQGKLKEVGRGLYEVV